VTQEFICSKCILYGNVATDCSWLPHHTFCPVFLLQSNLTWTTNIRRHFFLVLPIVHISPNVFLMISFQEKSGMFCVVFLIIVGW